MQNVIKWIYYVGLILVGVLCTFVVAPSLLSEPSDVLFWCGAGFAGLGGALILLTIADLILTFKNK